MSSRQDVTITIFARFCTAALSAISAVIVIRALGIDGLGIFGLLRILPHMLWIFTEMGFGHSSPYLLNNQREPPQRVLSMLLAAGMAIAIVEIVLWLLVVPVMKQRLFEPVDWVWLLAASGLAPMKVFQRMLLTFLRATGRFKFVNSMLVGLEAFVLMSLLASWAMGALDHNALVLGLLIGNGLVTLLAGLFVWRQGLQMRPNWDRELGRVAFKFGIKAQAGQIMEILSTRIDHVFLGIFSTTAAVGIYIVATKAAEVLKFIAPAVRFVTEPALARLTKQGAIEQTKRLFWRVFLLNGAVMVLGGLIGPYIISLVFGDASVEAILPFHLLLIGITANGASGVISAYNLGQGYPENNAIPAAIGAVVTVVLDVILIPAYGPSGAAIASSAAYSAMAALQIFLFKRNTGNVLSAKP